MANFGLFQGSSKTALQEFEGDYMQQDGEYVRIQISATMSQAARTVAAIRLDKGQCVKEIR